MTTTAMRHRMEHPWVEWSGRNQGTTTLFRDTNEFLLQGLLIVVGEVHIVEFHPANLFQLFLDPTSGFQRLLQTAAYRVFVVVFMRIQELEEPGDGMADGNGITLIQVSTQREILRNGIAEGAFTHF